MYSRLGTDHFTPHMRQTRRPAVTDERRAEALPYPEDL
ncbi:hypothetical protein GGE07_002884 [Sinorhizobium terangae]|nr:hypothetical protein [Sinorhizobium terangae]